MPLDVDKRLAIGDLVAQLCERAGVEYTLTNEIIIRPSQMVVTSYVADANGKPAIDKGKPLTATVVIEVST